MAMFEMMRSAHEKIVEVQVGSVQEIDKTQREKITKALKKKLQRDVKLECYIDSTLIGGIVIRAGDLVIDGSVRSKLNRLAQTMIEN